MRSVLCSSFIVHHSSFPSVSDQLEVDPQLVDHLHRLTVLDLGAEPPQPDGVEYGLVKLRMCGVTDDVNAGDASISSDDVADDDLILDLRFSCRVGIPRVILRHDDQG